MAVFSTADPTDEAEVFFSPACFPVAEAFVASYDGEPCEPPAPDGLVKLIGPDDAWERLLGGRPRLPWEDGEGR